nr:MAG: replication associated protein [Cressdnaviricota sp.]
MSKTDRQTDRSTMWTVTAYNDEKDMLERCRKGEELMPIWVKQLSGGLEKCPKTGNEHFQGDIRLTNQQRRSAIKKWLPTAHLEVTQNKHAHMNYVMKDATAIGEKSQHKNEREFLDNEGILRLLARQHIEPFETPEGQTFSLKAKEEYDFWERVKKILPDKPYLIGLLAKPDIYRAWKYTKSVWSDLVSGENEIITPEEAPDDAASDA